jgi:hypothetical protein
VVKRVAADVGASIDNQNALVTLRRKALGKHAAGKAGARNDPIIHSASPVSCWSKEWATSRAPKSARTGTPHGQKESAVCPFRPHGALTRDIHNAYSTRSVQEAAIPALLTAQRRAQT